MSKNSIVKLGVILSLLALVHSIFWFFKTGQLEKKIKSFVEVNSNHISVGEISVSGFPFTQKITAKDLKINIPAPVVNKNSILAKQVEITSGIFSSGFVVSLIGEVSIQDNETSLIGNIEFSKDPEIKISFKDNLIESFSYHDFGYRVLDSEKNVLYAATTSNLDLKLTKDDGKVKMKINADIKDIENFDIISIYKTFEKKIIEGIKTGEISIGSNGQSAPILLPSQAESTAPTMANQTIENSNKAQITDQSQQQNSTSVATNNKSEEVSNSNDSGEIAKNEDSKKSEDVSVAIDNNNLIKSNFILDAEYIISSAQEEVAIVDPTNVANEQNQGNQNSENVAGKVFIITNLEFSNPIYKATLNGKVGIFEDDPNFSGSITLKVEKYDNLLNYIVTSFSKANEKKENGISDYNDAYQEFLKKIIIGLPQISKEVMIKNQLSKEDLAVFEIRREKNLDFLINETPIREVMGKF
jgi:hypothetical protein